MIRNVLWGHRDSGGVLYTLALFIIINLDEPLIWIIRPFLLAPLTHSPCHNLRGPKFAFITSFNWSQLTL